MACSRLHDMNLSCSRRFKLQALNSRRDFSVTRINIPSKLRYLSDTHTHTYSRVSTETFSAVWVLTWGHTGTHRRAQLWISVTLSHQRDGFFFRGSAPAPRYTHYYRTALTANAFEQFLQHNGYLNVSSLHTDYNDAEQNNTDTRAGVEVWKLHYT